MTRRSEKKVAIVQSNYIPWKGYFDLINAVDEFILFDDVQYTRRDWRNRNIIKTAAGPAWLTIPVQVAGRYHSPIKEIEVDGQRWREQHWRTIVANYARAPYFERYRPVFEPLYLDCSETRLSLINRRFIEAICGAMGIATALSWSMDYRIVEGKTARIVSLCQQAGAGTYVSGPSARGYIDEESFEAAGIHLQYFEYSDYAEYPQLHPPFVHRVSALDLLLNVGPDASTHLQTSPGRRVGTAAS